jgi:hypothetical protein
MCKNTWNHKLRNNLTKFFVTQLNSAFNFFCRKLFSIFPILRSYSAEKHPGSINSTLIGTKFFSTHFIVLIDCCKKPIFSLKYQLLSSCNQILSCVSVCVCVCVRERDTERERDRERERLHTFALLKICQTEKHNWQDFGVLTT